MAPKTEQEILEQADRDLIGRVMAMFDRKGWQARVITPFGEFGQIDEPEKKRKKLNSFKCYNYQELVDKMEKGDTITVKVLPEHDEDAARNLAAAIGSRGNATFGAGQIKTKYHPESRIIEVKRPMDLES